MRDRQTDGRTDTKNLNILISIEVERQCVVFSRAFEQKPYTLWRQRDVEECIVLLLTISAEAKHWPYISNHLTQTFTSEKFTSTGNTGNSSILSKKVQHNHTMTFRSTFCSALLLIFLFLFFAIAMMYTLCTCTHTRKSNTHTFKCTKAKL